MKGLEFVLRTQWENVAWENCEDYRGLCKTILWPEKHDVKNE